MGAFGSFASPFSQARPIQAPSPFEYAAQFGQLQALAQQRDVRQQQLELGRQEQQANQLKIQQAQQAQEDQRRLTQAYMDSGGDLEKFRAGAAKSGASLNSITTVEEALLKHRREVEGYNKDQLANYEAQNAAIRNASESLLAIEDPNQRAAAFQQMKPKHAQVGITDLPDQLPAGPEGDQWLQMHRNWALSAEQISNRAKAKQEAEKATREAEEKRRVDAANELSTLTDQTGQVLDRKGYDALTQKYPGLFPPVPDTGFNQRFTLNYLIPAEKRPEVEATRRLASKPREQWMDEVVQNVPAQVVIDGKTYDTSGLQQRTADRVKHALDRGNFKEADDAIKDAGKTINATEPAVRTAKATAPTKIEIAGAVAEKKAEAASEGLPDAVSHLPPIVARKAMAEKLKFDAAYNKAQASEQRMNTIIGLMRQGNKLAYSISPVEGVLDVVTPSGTVRINRQELEQYAHAGSMFDRLAGRFGGALTGASIPANVVNDMESMHAALGKAAREQYKNNVQSLNSTYGSKFAVDEGGGQPTGGGSQAPKYKVGDSVMYNGAPHKILDIKPNGKLVLAQ